jgi:hypothetical protein
MQRLKEKPYYTRIALLGIAMYLFIEVVILIVTLIFEPSEWAYACIVGGIAGALGAVIYFVRPWGLLRIGNRTACCPPRSFVGRFSRTHRFQGRGQGFSGWSFGKLTS